MPALNKRRGQPDRKVVPMDNSVPARVPPSPAAIERLEVSAYTVPTDFPESDGTLAWNKTTIVIVEALSGGVRALGYTYASPAAAALIQGMLAEVVQGKNAMDVTGCWSAMVAAVRNLGRRGIAAMAI